MTKRTYLGIQGAEHEKVHRERFAYFMAVSSIKYFRRKKKRVAFQKVPPAKDTAPPKPCLPPPPPSVELTPLWKRASGAPRVPWLAFLVCKGYHNSSLTHVRKCRAESRARKKLDVAATTTAPCVGERYSEKKKLSLSGTYGLKQT